MKGQNLLLWPLIVLNGVLYCYCIIIIMSVPVDREQIKSTAFQKYRFVTIYLNVLFSCSEELLFHLNPLTRTPFDTVYKTLIQSTR